MHAEHPFSSTYSKGVVFSTDALRESLARLDHSLGSREPFLLVTGDAGTGKTTLVREATALWGDRATVVVLTHPMLARAELIEEIARRLGAEPSAGATMPQLIACVQRALADVTAHGRTPVLVVEDAHQASDDLLDELRRLVNSEAQEQRALEVVLVGPPALERRLAGASLAAIRERVSVECRVVPLTHKETRHYLYHRVRAAGSNGPKLFPRRTCSEIYDRTHGVPRAVNTLAAEALRRAREAGTSAVTHDHVRAAAEAQVRPLAVPIEPAALESAPLPRRPVVTSAAPEAVGVAAADVAESNAPMTPASAIVAREIVAPEAIAPETVAPETVAPETVARESPLTPLDGDLAPEAIEPSVAGAPSADPRVRQWVTRFIGNQGPPRIGVAFAFTDYDPSAEDGSAVIGESPCSDAGASTSGGESPPASTEAESLDPFEEPRPRRRASAAPRPRPRRRNAGPAIAIALFVLAALGLVVFLSQRRLVTPRGGVAASSMNAIASDREAPTTPPVDRAVRTPQSAQPTPGVAGPAIASRSAAGVHRTVASRAEAEPANSGAADRAAPATSRQRHTLEIGTFLDPGNARLERDRLAAESGLNAWVIRVREYGDDSYRIVLGVFSTPERAENSADILLERGIVTDVRVVPLPPRHARQ